MGGIQAALRFIMSGYTVVAVSLAGFAMLFVAENYTDSVPFIAFVTALLAFVLFFVTRRIAFSVYAAWALMALVTVVSLIKHLLTGSGLHAYDLLFVASDSSLTEFLLAFYPQYVFPLIGFLAVAVLILAVIAVTEQPRGLGAGARMALVAAMLLGAVGAYPSEASSHLYGLRGSHASSLAVSLRDILHFWTPSPLIARLQALPPTEAYPEIVACGPADRRPDVIFLHGESYLPPSFVPHWKVTADAVGEFASHDGKVRHFGVETYGGGSWLTVMSVMSGISAADFGWMRPYLVKALNGRIEKSVPQLLRQCGYHTAAVMATKQAFADLGPFLRSIDFDEIVDADATLPPTPFVRDRHHLDAAEALIRENRSAGGKPLFLFVETLFPHSPYDDRLEPDTIITGEPFHADPQIAEFLRRLAMSREDVAAFTAGLAESPGPQGTILLEYGDHQPVVTRRLPGPDGDGGTDLTDWSAPEFETYFAVDAFGPAEPPRVPDFRRMDAAFAGYWLIEAVGLVTGGVAQDVARLADACGGLFHLCPARAEVDRMLRRRIDAGLLDLTGSEFGWTD